MRNWKIEASIFTQILLVKKLDGTSIFYIDTRDGAMYDYEAHSSHAVIRGLPIPDGIAFIAKELIKRGYDGP